MTSPNKWQMISRTREEYMEFKEQRERTVGQGTLYTSLILLDGFPDAFILPATIEASTRGFGANIVNFCIKHPYSLASMVESPGTIEDGLWVPDSSDKLAFTIPDENRSLMGEESYFLPYQEGGDLSRLRAAELIGAGA